MYCNLVIVLNGTNNTEKSRVSVPLSAGDVLDSQNSQRTKHLLNENLLLITVNIT